MRSARPLHPRIVVAVTLADLVLLCIAGFVAVRLALHVPHALPPRPVPTTAAVAIPKPFVFARYANEARSTLLGLWYGDGRWRTCLVPNCPRENSDWGTDSLVFTLALRWETAHEPGVLADMRALVESLPAYDQPCNDRSCRQWSDVPVWDSVAALREYGATGDPRDLAAAELAFDIVDRSPVYARGACRQIDYQQPFGRPMPLKTLETDANAIHAALLLARATGNRYYLRDAERRYAAVRRVFLDSAVPLYTVYVFDDGKTCRQLPHRFFASVNGIMIQNGLLLASAAHQARYRADAIATAAAVNGNLADPRGVYADLQAENDIVEPLVEAMYRLALDERVDFARAWILRNASAAVWSRGAGGFARFFDGPPQTNLTAWQTNGGFALMFAAAALAPQMRPPPAGGWSDARYVYREVDTLPAEIRFTGAGIAVVGTLGERCCQGGRARVYVDGSELFDHTGIWQNKTSSSRTLDDTTLFAWQWPVRGAHTLRFEAGSSNAKEGGGFLHVRGYYVR